MPNLLRVDYCGQVAAIVVPGQAVIADTLSEQALRHVQAKCLYALELMESGCAEQYTDVDAEDYAKSALGTS